MMGMVSAWCVCDGGVRVWFRSCVGGRVHTVGRAVVCCRAVGALFVLDSAGAPIPVSITYTNVTLPHIYVLLCEMQECAAHDSVWIECMVSTSSGCACG